MKLRFEVPDDLEALDDAQLDALAGNLAMFRTEVRLEQNRVADEQTARSSVTQFPGDQREAMLKSIRQSLENQRKEREQN